MNGSRWTLAAGAVLLVAASAPRAGAEGPDVRGLFPRQADIYVDRAGLSRLVLPAPVLAACRPDLSDLRLFDARDLEVAFLVDRGTAPPSAAEMSLRYTPPVLEARRTQIERKGLSPLREETFELGLPDIEPQGGNWVLVLDGAPPEFVAGVEVVGIGAGEEATLVEGSLFRLRGSRSVEKRRLPLPPFAGGTVRVIVVSDGATWLNPSFRIDSARLLEGGGRIAVPLEMLTTKRHDGRTLVELARPPGVVPDLLRIETATGTFDRAVQVWDDGPGSAAGALGSENLFRVEAGIAVGDLELELTPARGDRLRVEIDDGDSPPLEGLSFTAEIRQPSLVFSLPPFEPDGPAGRLRFGGGRAHRPRYDLAALLPVAGRTVTGARAEAAAMLFDPGLIGAARLAPAAPNPLYDRTPALGFAMRAGAEIDPGAYGHLRRLHVPGAPEGLSRLRLVTADLALLKDDLSDLRISGPGARQWPYLVEPDAATELMPFRVEGPGSEDSRSTYDLVPPVPRVQAQRLVLDIPVPYFDRAYQLVGHLDGGATRTLARGRLVRLAGDPRSVGVDLAPARVRSLELIVEDGDDAPLPLGSAHGVVRLPDLFLAAPEGDYTLLLGDPAATRPRYELERVRDVVLAVQAAPIATGPLLENPDYSLRSRLKGKDRWQRVLLWGVLVLAVLALTFLTLRVARGARP